MKHTEGRLEIMEDYSDGLDLIIARTDPEFNEYVTICRALPANARRLVACWNACEGRYTEWLEQNSMTVGDVVLVSPERWAKTFDTQEERDELLSWLQRHYKLEEGAGETDRPEYIKLRALLAKYRVPA